MDFLDQLKTLQVRLISKKKHVLTEESTKTALVMPMLNLLGYNVFDPTEVIPEFVADVGTKKGEKVDYAIFQNGKPIMLIECKKVEAKLDINHAAQLYRYFSVTEVKFAILTNGIQYQFYTDIDKTNQMDSKPFFEFDFENFKDSDVNELKKFGKSAFNVENIQNTASELKYIKGIKLLISEELKNPSDDFVKYFSSKTYEGRLTKSIKDLFKVLTKKAFQQFLREHLEEKIDSLNKALDEETSSQGPEEQSGQEKGEKENELPSSEKRIETTEEELEGYLIVKAILRETIDVKRITVRDRIAYCGILLDDNNRKPICRLHFNGKQKYLGLFDEEKNEYRKAIDDLNEIYNYAEQLSVPVKHYELNK